jgi:FAD synthetase
VQTHRPEEIALSYNGGKDCVVLLMLILACFPTRPALTTFETNETPSDKPRPLQGVYIVSQHPFPEVEDFVTSSATQYHIDLARYVLPMRPALEAYLREKKSVRAIFVGTRRTDPHGKFLTHFDRTDGDWPRFMRVHPVIDWHYAEIWAVSEIQFPSLTHSCIL